MKTKIKALALFLSAVLLVVTTVFATMAFLTSTDEVTNTFTVGKVKITLDETDVDLYGVKDSETRVKENEYKLIPGHEYTKDPIVHVDAQSEDCWLFVKLQNGLKNIIAADTIEDQMSRNGWTCIDETNNIWAYREIVKANAHVDVFDKFKLTDNAVVSDFATEKDNDGNVTGRKTIEVTAYAVQADGFNEATKNAVVNATDAWKATFGAPTSSAN